MAGFVLQGIWRSYGVKLIDTSSSTRAYLTAVAMSRLNVSAAREKKKEKVLRFGTEPQGILRKVKRSDWKNYHSICD